MDAYNELRILVIDDNPEIQKDFKKILSFEKKNNGSLDSLDEALFGKSEKPIISLPKFRIDSALQGEEGIKLILESLAEKKPYALAFVDIRMPPGIDGIETIKRILVIDSDIQLVICTAYSDYSWEKIIEQLGERENLLILKKPFDHVSVRQIAMALTKKWQLMHATFLNTKMLEEKVEERTATLKFQASHDPLTKLPNRRFLFDFIFESIKHSEHDMSKFALMFVDLDRFKLINDSFSHATGDELLIQVSERIQKNLRDNDFVARLSGDEFVLVVFDFNSTEVVKKIAKKILAIFNEPFALQDHKVIVPASIGISIFPYDAKTADELIKCADLAMYHAKSLGGNQFRLYFSELQHENLKHLELETDLYSALKNNEFFLCYQPQINIKQNKIVSVEALIRWRHPTRGILRPIDFIPLAEDIGIFAQLGDWIIKEACEQNVRWQTMGYKPIVVAVNIATHQFKQPDLVEKIASILKETGLQSKYLELEITENVLVTHSYAVNKIAQLKELGVTIAIDDFGTGYSGLSYLKDIKLDKLKIDQSFVKNINVNTSDEVIIQAILTMANSLHVQVIAEGIETKKQLDFLQANLCEEGQGFYFSKPLESIELEKILQKN